MHSGVRLRSVAGDSGCASKSPSGKHRFQLGGHARDGIFHLAFHETFERTIGGINRDGALWRVHDPAGLNAIVQISLHFLHHQEKALLSTMLTSDASRITLPV